jgi:hypothetical protein
MKTSHWLVMLTTALAWVSCTDGLFKRCPTGTECGAGEVCLDAVCVVRGDGDAGSAGGLAGGAAGGAAGGTSGGTSGGASGGTAGGLGTDDAGPSVQVRLVSSPPAIDIIPAATLEPRFRRDDEVLVEVWSNDTDVDPAQTRVLVGAEDVRFTPEEPCDAGAVCSRVRVRLADVELPAIEATLGLRARMVDRAGNTSSVPLDGGVPATRLAWARELCRACSLAGPALTPVGTLLVVANNRNDAGSDLIEFAPDGGERSRRLTIEAQAVSTIVTGPTPQTWTAVLTRRPTPRNAVSSTYGFYPSGGDGGVCAGLLNASQDFDLDIPALADPGSLNASVIGIQTYVGNGVRLGRFRPDLCRGINMGEVGQINNARFPSNIVLSSGTGSGRGYLLDVGNGLTSFERGMNADPGLPLVRGARFDAGVVGLALVSGGAPSELAFTTENELVLTRFPSLVDRVPGTAFSRPIAIDGGVVVVAGTGAHLRTYSWLSDGGVTEFSQRLNGFSSAPRPVAPIAGSSELYAMDNNTVVYAIDRSDGGVSTFGRPRDVELGAPAGEPTLWCRRGRPNALFAFTTSNGYLVALLVDSARVDGNAPWPMPFHDTQNTNAADTVERACP